MVCFQNASKKLKKKMDEAHRDKIELLQTIMELEKGQGREQPIEGPGSPEMVVSPHLQRGALNETLDVHAHSPSDPKPSDYGTAPRRGRTSPKSPEEQLLAGFNDDLSGEEGEEL